MSDRDRHAAFALAVVVVLAATVLFKLLGRDGAPAQPEPPSQRRAVVVGGAATPSTTATPSKTATAAAPSAAPGRVTTAQQRAVARDPGPVLATARRFLDAQLRWEGGDRSPSTRAAIHTLALPRVARLVLAAAAPRATLGGFRPAHGDAVRAVDLSDAQPRRGVAVVATVARGAAIRTQTLRLDGHGSRWRLTSLG